MPIHLSEFSQMTFEDFQVFILQLVGQLGLKDSTDCVCVCVRERERERETERENVIVLHVCLCVSGSSYNVNCSKCKSESCNMALMPLTTS